MDKVEQLDIIIKLVSVEMVPVKKIMMTKRLKVRRR